MNKSHPKSIVIILVCVIIISAGYVLSTKMNGDKYKPTDNPSPGEIASNKQQIINRVQDDENTPLSQDEKSSLFNMIGGEKALQYNFSPEEKEAILRALNKK